MDLSEVIPADEYEDDDYTEEYGEYESEDEYEDDEYEDED